MILRGNNDPVYFCDDKGCFNSLEQGYKMLAWGDFFVIDFSLEVGLEEGEVPLTGVHLQRQQHGHCLCHFEIGQLNYLFLGCPLLRPFTILFGHYKS